MNEQKFTELLGHIDPALIARAEKPVPMRQKPIFKRALIAAVAAMLALTMCASLIIIPFIPTTLGLDYLTSPSDGTEIAFKEQNAWIYYVENGKEKREYVRLPGDTQNVFMAWKHLNGLDESAQLLDVTYNDEANWSGRYITVQLSTALRDHPNSEALLDSLQKTLARSFGVMKQNVSFIFNDTVESPLQFYYDLQDAYVGTGFRIDITVGMRNVSVDNFDYSGIISVNAAPEAFLTMNGSTVITHDEIFMPDEYMEQILSPGESREITYTFDIPADAPTGSYDLILSFGESSMTFEGAVEVVESTVTDIGTFTISTQEFEKFMQENYLEDTTIFETLRIFYTYTYQGRMIEYDEIIRDDLVNGGTSERAFNSLFAYNYLEPTNRADGIYQSASFTGKAIPDSLAPFDQDPKSFALPCGITEQDTLLQALCKMGMSEAVAMTLLENPTSLTLAGNSAKNLSFIISEEGDRYAVRYQTTNTVYANDNLAETTTRILMLEYNANGKFLQFTIEVKTELSAPGKYYGNVAFTRYHGGYQVDWQFDQEQKNWFLNLLNNGTWLEGTPIYSDFTLEPMIRIGDHYLLYVENYLIDGNTYMELNTEQWARLREIVDNFPFFQRGPIHVTNVATSDTRMLNEEEFHQLLIILNRNTWNYGAPEFDYDYELELEDQTYYYSSSSSLIWGNNICLFLLTEADQVIANSVICGKGLIYFERSATVRVDSPYDDLEHYAKLSDTHRDQIISILNSGDWKSGTPDMPTDDYGFTANDSFAEYKIRYSPTAGIFLLGDHYLHISNEDMNTIDEIVGGYAVQMPDM